MPKGGKSSSSASSATRKKHARKAATAAAPPIDEQQPPEKQKKPKNKEKGAKSKAKEPRVKVYIPPVKPAPVQPDPLDTTQLANLLPPDLLVVLRKLGKKHAITKVVALEELQSAWVSKCSKRADDESPTLATLVTMLPVWMHHIPSLFVHPSRKVRLLAVSLHASLLHIERIREHIIAFLRDTAPLHQCESILGTWCLAAHDIDRQVSAAAIKSWNEVISISDQDRTRKWVLSDEVLNRFLSFVQRAVLDPAGLYTYLNPQPPSVAPTPPRRVPGRSTPLPILKKEDVELSYRSKGEDEAEDEQDRKARLRVSSLGVLKWILDTPSGGHDLTSGSNLMELFANPALWTSLHHAESSPIAAVESFGFGQPVVRRAAWSFLQSLLRNHKQSMQPLLSILSVAVLRSAWVEPDALVRSAMWQPLLSYLREFPSAWELDAGPIPSNTREAGEASSSDEDESDDDTPQPTTQSLKKPSLAYQEFLRFLELGCSGSPLQGYPIVIIVISTLPPSIMASSSSQTPLTDFFTSFWAAVDGRALSALERTSTAASFLSSLFECILFFTKRILQEPMSYAVLFPLSPSPSKTSPDYSAELQSFVKDQFARTWEALVSRRLRAEHSTAGKAVAQTLVSLDQAEPGLFQAAWSALTAGIQTEASAANPHAASLISAFLDAFDETFEEGSSSAIASRSLIRDVVQTSIQRCRDALAAAPTEISSVADGVAPLANNFNAFGVRLFADPEFSEHIDDILMGHAYRLLLVAPSLLQAYLSHRSDEEKCQCVWHLLLDGVSRHSGESEIALATLLDAAEKGSLSPYLRPRSDELNGIVNALLAEALGGPGGAPQLTLLRRMMKYSDRFLSDDTYQGLLQSLTSSFVTQVAQALRDPANDHSKFCSSLKLIDIVVSDSPRSSHSDGVSARLLPEIFILAYLLPRGTDSMDTADASTARDLWLKWVKDVSPDLQRRVLSAIKGRLKVLLADTSVRVRPDDILRLIHDGCPGLHIDLTIRDIFPSQHELDRMLEALSPDPIHPSLAIFDPLVHTNSSFESQLETPPPFDDRGYSAYARIVGGLVHAFAHDRRTAKGSMWVLRHVLTLALYASDLVNVHWAPSPVFGQQVSRAQLNDMLSKVQQVAMYLLTSSADGGWRSRVIASVLNEKHLGDSDDGLSRFLADSIRVARDADDVREARILSRILQRVLDEADANEADQWVMLARKMEKTSPETSLAIISSVARYAPEPPRLDRYRNELAAGLLGVPASKANTDGLLILHRLYAVAPDPDSDVIFLPQQRAVNVVKTCQRWVSSDEDVDEDVECGMTAVFVHLVPILQNVPGGHWDFIFDVVENNLENCSFGNDTTWVLLARTLQLIVAVQDLVPTNKFLREEWQGRQKPIYALVRNMITTPLDDAKASKPRSVCLELALKILQDLPSSVIDENTLQTTCHLIMDSSSDVQKMAYRFLQEAAKTRTESVVVEAAVDTTGNVKADLPLELVDLLLRNVPDGEEGEVEGQELFGYFLGWMITFDLFANASLKVRSGYIDHLRKLEIVPRHFIPTIFSLLRLYDGTPKAIKLDIWAVDEFFIQYCEPDNPTSIQLLAAHLYYRSLLTIPSLIRAWVLECKDRQLYMTAVSYTSQYFSQILTQAELAHLKSPESMAELVDDHMTVKVATSVNEVTAAYTIDEHQLEITLKLPSDWPLHPIEVKDTKKVGVVDNRWRAWVLGVQQTIWAHNGRIADGLSLFKKNVALHFEGQVECAICYSIISVTDQSLPRKPCKTCKNRFHSGCLYKWFNTSHSSSCPLCRSDII